MPIAGRFSQGLISVVRGSSGRQQSASQADALRSSLKHLRVEFHSGLRHELPVGKSSLHHHPYIEVVYHLRGRGRTTFADGRSVAFTAGSVEIYPPLMAHAQANDEPGEDVCVFISVTPPLAQIVAMPLYHESLEAQSAVHEMMAQAAEPSPAHAMAGLVGQALARAILLVILAEKLHSGRRGHETALTGTYACKARDFLQRFAAEKNSLQRVATHVGISGDHLRHVFRRCYRVSLKEYQLRVRMEKARSLIVQTTLPLKVIGHQCGFVSVRYFCARFRRHTGLSPGRYRRRYQLAKQFSTFENEGKKRR